MVQHSLPFVGSPSFPSGHLWSFPVDAVRSPVPRKSSNGFVRRNSRNMLSNLSPKASKRSRTCSSSPKTTSPRWVWPSLAPLLKRVHRRCLVCRHHQTRSRQANPRASESRRSFVGTSFSTVFAYLTLPPHAFHGPTSPPRLCSGIGSSVSRQERPSTAPALSTAVTACHGTLLRAASTRTAANAAKLLLRDGKRLSFSGIPVIIVLPNSSPLGCVLRATTRAATAAAAAAWKSKVVTDSVLNKARRTRK